MSIYILLFHFLVINFHKNLIKQLINPDVWKHPDFSILSCLLFRVCDKLLLYIKWKDASFKKRLLTLCMTMLFRLINPGDLHLTPVMNPALVQWKMNVLLLQYFWNSFKNLKNLIFIFHYVFEPLIVFSSPDRLPRKPCLPDIARLNFQIKPGRDKRDFRYIKRDGKDLGEDSGKSR